MKDIFVGMFIGFCIGIAFGLAWKADQTKPTKPIPVSQEIYTNDMDDVVRPMHALTPP